MNIFQIIKLVADTSSTKEKQAILERNRDNDVLRNAFMYTENSRFNFYIRFEPSAAIYGIIGGDDLTDASFKIFDDLRNRVVTGNDARDIFMKMISKLTPEAAVIAARILNRDLRCNCGTAIANKVWKGLIPEYPVMLCSKYDAKAEKYLKKFENKDGFFVELKADGGRLLVTVDIDGKVTYRSRNGSELELYGVFDNSLSKHTGMVFDGELIVATADGKPDRKRGNGFYTKAVRGTLSKEDAANFTYMIWDAIPIDEYTNDLGTTPYSVRREYVRTAKFKKNVGVVESKKVSTLAECVEFYDRMRAEGQEGAIIKVADAVFEDTRSKNSVKLKNVSTADLICIRVEEGAGKFAGKIGALICQTSDGLVEVGVGTGFKDADREKDPSEYIGKVIEVSYNEVISSKDPKVKTKSLFLPVYLQIRFDKQIANTLGELV